MVGTFVLSMNLMKYFNQYPTDSITKEDLFEWAKEQPFWELLIEGSPNPEKLLEDTFEKMINTGELYKSILGKNRYYSPEYSKGFYKYEGDLIIDYIKLLSKFIYREIKRGGGVIKQTWIVRDDCSYWQCPSTDYLVKSLQNIYPEFKFTVEKASANTCERIVVDWS